MNTKKLMWSIDRIEAQEWRTPKGVAVVWASNYSHDEMDFCIVWHPDGFAFPYDITRHFVSEDIFPYDAEEIIKDQLLDEAVKRLDAWWLEVKHLSENLAPKEWDFTRGLAAPEVLYAKCAQLYSIRADFYPLKVVKLLAEDMSVPESTVKERLRKAREKGFLTAPGKGLNGQGKVTKKAIQLIEKEEKK